MDITEQYKPRFQIAPAGMHLARLYQFIDLGNQKNTFENNGTIKRKAYVGFELPHALLEVNGEHKPFTIGREIPISLHPDGLFPKIVRALTGAKPEVGMHTSQLLGQSCNIVVEHIEKEEKTSAKITSYMPLNGTEQLPAQCNPSIDFSLDPNEDGQIILNTSIFNHLPEWLQKKIMLSPQYQKAEMGSEN